MRGLEGHRHDIAYLVESRRRCRCGRWFEERETQFEAEHHYLFRRRINYLGAKSDFHAQVAQIACMCEEGNNCVCVILHQALILVVVGETNGREVKREGNHRHVVEGAGVVQQATPGDKTVRWIFDAFCRSFESPDATSGSSLTHTEGHRLSFPASLRTPNYDDEQVLFFRGVTVLEIGGNLLDQLEGKVRGWKGVQRATHFLCTDGRRDDG